MKKLSIPDKLLPLLILIESGIIGYLLYKIGETYLKSDRELGNLYRTVISPISIVCIVFVSWKIAKLSFNKALLLTVLIIFGFLFVLVLLMLFIVWLIAGGGFGPVGR